MAVPSDSLAAGDGFGDRPPPPCLANSTAEAQTDITLLVIHRTDFLAAVLGSPESAATANAVIATRTQPRTLLRQQPPRKVRHQIASRNHDVRMWLRDDRRL